LQHPARTADPGHSPQTRANHAAKSEADVQEALRMGFTLHRRMTAKSPKATFESNRAMQSDLEAKHTCKNRSFWEDGHMIMRIFQVITKHGKEEEFGKFFHEAAIPLMKGTKGIVQVLPGAPRSDSPREFSFVMIWDSLESLKAFVGEDYQSPHIDPSEAELVEFRTIKHYELVDLVLGAESGNA